MEADGEIEPRRDLVWQAMHDFASRARARAGPHGLVVKPVRRRFFWSWTVEDSLWVGNWTVDVYEPVRSRRFFSKEWTELQPVAEAASAIGGFLRERPDLGPRTTQ